MARHYTCNWCKGPMMPSSNPRNAECGNPACAMHGKPIRVPVAATRRTTFDDVLREFLNETRGA